MLQAIGVDNKKLALAQPESGEDALEVADAVSMHAWMRAWGSAGMHARMARLCAAQPRADR